MLLIVHQMYVYKTFWKTELFICKNINNFFVSHLLMNLILSLNYLSLYFNILIILHFSLIKLLTSKKKLKYNIKSFKKKNENA